MKRKKSLTCFRSFVRQSLFVVGATLMVFAFGNDDMPIADSIACHLGLFAAGAAVFTLLGMLEASWRAERNGEE